MLQSNPGKTYRGARPAVCTVSKRKLSRDITYKPEKENNLYMQSPFATSCFLCFSSGKIQDFAKIGAER